LDTAREIIGKFRGERAELVVCDGAPDVTGLHDVDEYLQGQLLLAAMLITTHVLCERGTFVAKMFRGRNVGFLTAQLRQMFRRVSVAKPSSSRNSSMEAFVVCQHFKGRPYLNLPLDVGGYVNVTDLVAADDDSVSERASGNSEGNELLHPSILPFIACGDLSGWTPAGGEILDSDKSYPVPSQDPDAYIPPVAPPIDPPYETSIARQKEERRQKSKRSGGD